MNYSEKQIARMVNEGLSEEYAERVAKSDLHPQWRGGWSHRAEAKIAPWRCSGCGYMINTNQCLECHITSMSERGNYD
jgi:hypothetical protein